MSDEIFFDGVQYTSASFAAREVARTRDYIARLCKEEKVPGRRVGKNWYVDVARLKTFLAEQEALIAERREELSRQRAHEYRAHRPTESSEPQFINGVKYVAAAEAARESGMTRDYIGRLCREKKVAGIFAGTIWYVDTKSLQTFLITQEYHKGKRREVLAQKRSHEYQRNAVKRNVAAVDRNYMRDEKPYTALRTFTKVAPASLSVAQNSAPTYTALPTVQILNKIITLALIATITFGAYALIDPAGARN